MGAIARAIAAAATAQRRVDGTKVIYRRGGSDIPDLPVTKAIGRHELLDASGSLIQVQTQDFVIVAASLVLDGSPITPARGDKIIETRSDGDHTYEPYFLPDESCWKWSDSHQQTLRLHTQETGKP